jgi:16S rRNA (cytidine1402-2'-O)-methyltransferase
MNKGKLYLMPIWLGENERNKNIPSFNLETLDEIEMLICENGKSARQFIKKYYPDFHLQKLEYFEYNKHSGPDIVQEIIQYLKNGKNAGMMSEAGNPCIADPGSSLVRQAHRNQIPVIPLVGPSSILLCLIASGLNGQSFIFHGYLPKDKSERFKKIRQMEKDCTHTTQIFMETPYRNHDLITDLLGKLAPDTLLCVASNLTQRNEKIITLEVEEWMKIKYNYKDIPCMFAIGK